MGLIVVINERLNIVLPLYHGDDIYAWIHSAPISREAFETHYRLLTRTYSLIASEGLASAKVAHLFVADAAKALTPDGEDYGATSRPLLAEIHRLANVLMPTDAGWQTIPLQQAIDQRMIDADDVSEVLAAVVFFTAIWHMGPKQSRADLIAGGIRQFGARIESLNVTGFIASLQTLTKAALTGVRSTPNHVHQPLPTSPPPTVVHRPKPGIATVVFQDPPGKVA